MHYFLKMYDFNLFLPQTECEHHKVGVCVKRRQQHLMAFTDCPTNTNCPPVHRFHNHRNLQLCFINNSDSEEEEGGNKKVQTNIHQIPFKSD